MTPTHRGVYILTVKLMDMNGLDETDEMAPATPEMISPCLVYIFGNAESAGYQMIAHAQQCENCKERTGV